MNIKKTILWTLLIFVIVAGCVLVPITNTFITETKDKVIWAENNYDDFSPIDNNLFAVRNENGWGFIDNSGKEIIAPEFDSIDGTNSEYKMHFKDNLIAVEKNYKYGLVNNTGKVIVTPKYKLIHNIDSTGNNITYFQDGLALVRNDNGYYGYINEEGQEVIPCEYDDAKDFSDSMAPVKSGNKWEYINKEEQEVILCEYDDAEDFSDGLARVKSGNKWGYINKEGEEVILCEYDDAKDFSNGFALVESGNKWGYINKEGQVVIPLKYDNAQNFSDNLAIVEKNGKFGCVNKKGQEIVPVEYDDIGDFSEGIASIRIGNDENSKYGLIDEAGKVVLSPKYDKIRNFSESLAAVCENGKWGFIDKTGKIIVPTKYNSTGDFSEGLAEVEKSGLLNFNKMQGFIDATGNEVVSPKYDFVTNFSDNKAAAKVNGKTCIIISPLITSNYIQNSVINKTISISIWTPIFTILAILIYILLIEFLTYRIIKRAVINEVISMKKKRKVILTILFILVVAFTIITFYWHVFGYSYMLCIEPIAFMFVIDIIIAFSENTKADKKQRAIPYILCTVVLGTTSVATTNFAAISNIAVVVMVEDCYYLLHLLSFSLIAAFIISRIILAIKVHKGKIKLIQSQPLQELSSQSKAIRYCKNCGTELNENAKFCVKCGAKTEPITTEIVCPKCSNICKPTAKFCPKCGLNLIERGGKINLE